MVAALIVALVLLVLVVVWVIRLSVYKATHPYTDEDLKKKSKASTNSSRSTLMGKVSEQLAPVWPEFAEKYNFRDARFIGEPVDFIVFDGLEERRAISRVVFVEVKTGKPRLNENQRLVREAIESKNVEFEIISLDQGL